ncbi:MAG: hypothetical protein NZM43_01565 [Saprospiraceae bacterium]|nr:hypothetical protein [Saprospiraceae bacterium]MDW8482988.1 hypothetical protein [Saprospiraceae bacterium]
MEHHTLAVSRTAHYYVLGTPGPQIRQLWLACHGYGQLASEFLEQLRPLDDGYRLIVAPEGLNYFYKKSFDGPVGANWMTRYQRDAAIADNNAYLEALLHQYTSLLLPHVRLVLFGFSQGVATLCRWITCHHPPFDDFILWAGLPPEDLDYRKHANYLAVRNLFLYLSPDDPLITAERRLQVTRIEQRDGIFFHKRTFVGAHDIPADALVAAAALLERKADTSLSTQ